MDWEGAAKEKFDRMMEKIPPFMRPLALDKVSKKAESLAIERGKSQIDEQDMVDAFFEATPFGFHGPMKTDMESLGIDFVKYGHAK